MMTANQARNVPIARVVRETRSVLFIESKLKVGGRIVATASGIWKIVGEKWGGPGGPGGRPPQSVRRDTGR